MCTGALPALSKLVYFLVEPTRDVKFFYSRAIQQCDDMRSVISTRDDNLKTIQQLRIDMNSDSNVNSPINSSRSLRSTGRDDRKKLEDFLSDISSDLVGIQKKFDSLMNCVSGILNRLENIESRLATLANKETNAR